MCLYTARIKYSANKRCFALKKPCDIGCCVDGSNRRCALYFSFNSIANVAAIVKRNNSIPIIQQKQQNFKIRKLRMSKISYFLRYFVIFILKIRKVRMSKIGFWQICPVYAHIFGGNVHIFYDILSFLYSKSEKSECQK